LARVGADLEKHVSPVLHPQSTAGKEITIRKIRSCSAASDLMQQNVSAVIGFCWLKSTSLPGQVPRCFKAQKFGEVAWWVQGQWEGPVCCGVMGGLRDALL